ncbi:MAG: peptidyl-prolyl cis-trans isomerase [Bernardetiaceae bacterium]
MLARVGDDVLYDTDVKGLFGQSRDPEDSLNRLHRYVNNWIRKQLLLKEAEKNSSIDPSELERRLLDYKYQLLVHDYQKQYVEANLDTNIDEGEIKAYYASNKDNFELKKNIVKAYFVKIKDNDPKAEKIRQWIKSESEEDFQSLKDHCYQFALSYSLDDSLWVSFDELVLGSPISPQTYFRHNRFLEASDTEHLYFLRILDYRTTDLVSPLAFVRDQIQTILLNRRKLRLQEVLEEEVFESAKAKKKFDLFLPE